MTDVPCIKKQYAMPVHCFLFSMKQGEKLFIFKVKSLTLHIVIWHTSWVI